MTPYVVSLIEQEDIFLFNHVRDVILRLPDLELGTDETGKNIILSCHMLARAVRKVFSLRCVDGYFYPHYQHSWVETKHQNIIDLYPVGIFGGPILVHGNRLNAPGRHLYLRKATNQISQNRFSRQSFKRCVHQITRALKERRDA